MTSISKPSRLGLLAALLILAGCAGNVLGEPEDQQASLVASLEVSTQNARPGEAVTVKVSGGPAWYWDWVGVFRVGSDDYAHLDWLYLNGRTDMPGNPTSTATLTFKMPSEEGAYEFRFFANGGHWPLLAKSATVQVGVPGGTDTPQPSAVPRVLYENDGTIESGFNDEVIMAMASAGTINLVGMVTTATWEVDRVPDRPRLAYEERQRVIGLGVASGFANLPEHALGPTRDYAALGYAYDDAGIAAGWPMWSRGGQLIVEKAASASPSNPLIIVMGGQATAILDAYYQDRSIVNRVVLSWVVGHVRRFDGKVDGDEFNTDVDPWAAWAAIKLFKTKIFPWIDQVAPGVWGPNAPGFPFVPYSEMMARLPRSPIRTLIEEVFQGVHGYWDYSWEVIMDGAPIAALTKPWLFSMRPMSLEAGFKQTPDFPAWVLKPDPSGDDEVAWYGDSRGGGLDWLEHMSNPAAYH